DLGQATRDPRGSLARVRLVGLRSQNQLHRRDHGVLLLRPVHRLSVDRAVLAAALAVRAAAAPRLARREALPGEVRRALGRVHPPCEVPNDSVPLLKAGSTGRPGAGLAAVHARASDAIAFEAVSAPSPRRLLPGSPPELLVHDAP